jgi:hypothetical protein
LKSAFCTPLAIRYWPAGEVSLIEPAGEMWSVVTESPRRASTRAPCTSWARPALMPKSLKNGGSAM